MFKSLKKICFLFFISSCSGCIKNENFIEGPIIKSKALGLNPKTINEYVNGTKKEKFNLFEAQEILKINENKSIIKNAKNDYFLISNFNQNNSNFFDFNKIDIPETEKDKVKSFCHIQDQLFCILFERGQLVIKKIDKSNLVKITFSEVCNFNINSDEHFKKDFIEKIKPNICRKINNKNNVILSEVENIKFEILEKHIISCSDCCINRQNIVFIFIKCKVNFEYKGSENSIFINLGLTFDGNKIVPCLETGNYSFSDLNISSIKAWGNKIACSSTKEISDEKDLDNGINLITIGELFLNSEKDICFKSISSQCVDNLKDFSFLKTENNGAVLTTIGINNQDNTVEFGRLIGSKLTYQQADLVGIDLFETKKSKMPSNTRLRDYNMVFVNNNNVLLQYAPAEELKDENCYDSLLVLNKLKIPVVS